MQTSNDVAAVTLVLYHYHSLTLISICSKWYRGSSNSINEAWGLSPRAENSLMGIKSLSASHLLSPFVDFKAERRTVEAMTCAVEGHSQLTYVQS